VSRTPRVVVVGAGLGGLAAARALALRGVEVEVFEKVPVLGEVGAGIQVSPNSLKVLRALGLEDPVRAAGFEPQAWVWRDAIGGQTTATTPLKTACDGLYGAPYIVIHRGDLHTILQASVDPLQVHLGAACTGVRTEGKGAVASFADGREVEADLIVGADGIRSVVRAALFGDDTPRFTGDMCWRALIPVDAPDPALASRDVTVWRGPQGHVVTYYVRGGRAINLVAVREAPDWVEESWSTPSSPAELLAAYPGWRPELQTLFSRAQDVFKWGLFDRDPMARWTVGPITLMGDAAHPMLPYLAQGAAMAIEDAYVLAAAVATGQDDLPAALQAYEATRRPRTSQVQLRARAQGRRNHLTSPGRRLARDLAARLRGLVNPQNTGLKADWLYAHDVTAVAVHPAGE
jgi:salicylate hydroxylase